MNKILIFFCLSTAILALSIIVVCISPIINNISWNFSSWRTLNCKYFEDKQNDEDVKLDDIQKYRKFKTLCKSKKAMHDLEFASLFINLVLGFVCANFSLLHFLDVGKDFEKKTGMIGFVTGIIGFIITLVYVSFNGYIFNNDIAFGQWDYYGNNYIGGIKKLYPNGAELKCENSNCYIHVYDNDKNDFSEYVKYKDLGGKQYNYDYEYYKNHEASSNCKVPSSPTLPLTLPGCEYAFPNQQRTTSLSNKDLYDRWTTTLILSIFIVICNIGLLIFGFLVFKDGGANSNEVKTVEIQ